MVLFQHLALPNKLDWDYQSRLDIARTTVESQAYTQLIQRFFFQVVDSQVPSLTRVQEIPR